MNKPFYGAASITTSNRVQIINNQCSLGPGTYDLSKQKNSSSLPKWSLKPRLDYGSCFKQLKQNRPPPGTYQIGGNMKHKVNLENPNYRSDKYKQTNEKITHMSHLNLPSSINAKSGTIFGQRDEIAIFKETNYSPGPIYHVDKNVEQTRSNKIKNTCRGFGFGLRNGIYKKNQFVPGPGSYYSNEEESQKHASPTSSTFGKSPRSKNFSSNPLGPGEYNPMNQTFTSGRSFVLKGKLPQAQKYINPNGPGSYELPDTTSKTSPRFNNHRHKSNNFSQNDLPNPFTYECKRYPELISQNKGFSLGKKLTQSLDVSNMNPGPGSYQVTQDVSKPQHGGYMGRKMIKKKKGGQDDCFGKYDPKFSASARDGLKFSFSTSLKSSDKMTKDDKIGPAHYEVIQKRTVQSYSMGTSKRFKDMKKQLGVAYRQTNQFNSTIGYLPLYLRNNKNKTEK